MTRIAIIPARGGSKRIPRKNLKDFCGKPMIAWSIRTALESGCFDHVLVSTDDEEIAEIAIRYGAEVPFMRPPELADEFAATRPVINHAIEKAFEIWGASEFACCIYATVPFLLPKDLQSAFKMLRTEGACFVFSAGRFHYPIQRGLRVGDNGRVERLRPEHRFTRSQDLEETYHDAGQFYWGESAAWLEERPIFSEGAVPVKLPRHRVQDIDTLDDWVRAEWMFRAKQRQMGNE